MILEWGFKRHNDKRLRIKLRDTEPASLKITTLQLRKGNTAFALALNNSQN